MFLMIFKFMHEWEHMKRKILTTVNMADGTDI